jgi:uncharacterized protein with ATP-grasp and redox domains
LKTSFECIPCFLKQTIDACRTLNCDEITTTKIIKKVLKATADFDISATPPMMGQMIHRIIRESTGNPDPYIDIKKKSIDFALSLENRIRDIIETGKSPDDIHDGIHRFEKALRFSIAGNILDFALLSTWNEERINSSFAQALDKPLESSRIEELYERINQSSCVLYLADNAGETVFDKIFIDHFPGNAKVFYAVKGSPIINDACRPCAVESGIPEVAEIIETGSDAPGTILSDCNKAFLEHYESAPLVIAKGQANFETLIGAKREIFHLLQIKCGVIGNKFGYETGRWIAKTNNSITSEHK